MWMNHCSRSKCDMSGAEEMSTLATSAALQWRHSGASRTSTDIGMLFFHSRAMCFSTTSNFWHCKAQGARYCQCGRLLLGKRYVGSRRKELHLKRTTRPFILPLTFLELPVCRQLPTLLFLFSREGEREKQKWLMLLDQPPSPNSNQGKHYVQSRAVAWAEKRVLEPSPPPPKIKKKNHWRLHHWSRASVVYKNKVRQQRHKRDKNKPRYWHKK